MSSTTVERASGLDDGRVCLVVTGPPGAGKSTVTAAVARSLSRSALLSGDTIAQQVVGGYVWPLGEPRDEADRQVRLCNDNLCALARNVMAAGFTAVVDWVLPDAQQLETFRTALGSALRLVVLDPGADVCRARDRQRAQEERFAFDGYDGLRATMRQGFATRGWWFDTSGLDVDATVRAILAEADDRARC